MNNLLRLHPPDCDCPDCRASFEADRPPVSREPRYIDCPTRIHDGYEEPSDWPWRYAHAASIEGAHWNIYTALGDINRDHFIGMVEYEANAKAIVDDHNARLSENRND